METTNETVVPVHYNPNQLVTYKVIDLDAPEQTISYPTEKVTQIEWSLEQARRLQKSKNELQSQINKVIDNMTEDYWYNPNTDKETILNDICEIFNFNPVKTIEFSATISITGSIEIPLNEAEDFELDSYLADSISIDTYTGNVDIDGWDIDNAYEN